MTGTVLSLLSLLLLLGPEGVASGREELRAALREHHAHLMAERLELDADQARALRPRLDAVVEAQSRSVTSSRRAWRALQAELDAPAPDAARVERRLAAALEAEVAGVEGTASARRELLSGLAPDRRARYLLFEDRYREEVLRRVRQLRGGGPPPAAGEGPWRRARRSAAGAQEPPEPERRERLVDNLTLLFTLQAGQALDLETETLVGMVPTVEGVVETQVRLAELERRGRAALESALAEGRDGASLAREVDALLDEQDALRRELVEGRRALASSLDPVAGARLVLLQERFRREVPRRLRMLDRLLSAGPEGGGAWNQDQPLRLPPRWRERPR